eukprot:scpid42742/ scgid12971/ 
MARRHGLTTVIFLMLTACTPLLLDASPSIPEIRCPYHPSTIIKYFSVEMTFADATAHCQKFNAHIASKVSCVQDYLRPTDSVAWLAQKRGVLQTASDGKAYNLASQPAPKLTVVCEVEPEVSYTCNKTRAHIAVYANTGTYTQAKEQCGRLGGRLPAGSDEGDCLNHALHVATSTSPAKGARPWIEDFEDQPLNVISASYTLHESKRAGRTAQLVATVACAFNFREYFCEQANKAGGVTMVHYPYQALDHPSKTDAFCQEKIGRRASTHEMRCILEFRDLIYKETGHLENGLEYQVCVFDPREKFCLVAHRMLKFFPKKLSYVQAKDHCKRVISSAAEGPPPHVSIEGRLASQLEVNCISHHFPFTVTDHEKSAWIDARDLHHKIKTTSGASYNENGPDLNYVICSLSVEYHANSTYHFNEMDLVIAPNALSSTHLQTSHVCPKGTEHISVADLEPFWTQLTTTNLRHISFVHGNIGHSRTWSLYTGQRVCHCGPHRYADRLRWERSYVLDRSNWDLVCSEERPALLCGRRTTRKSETLCGNWKVLLHTQTFEKVTYDAAQDACRKNVGFFLPSEALWKSVLGEMKIGTPECRELAATFDKIPLWFTRHGKERHFAKYSSVCVGARLPGGAISSRGIRRDEGIRYVDESGRVKCHHGYRTSLRESIPAKPYKGIWQNTAGCYKYVRRRGNYQLALVREDGVRSHFHGCGGTLQGTVWQDSNIDGTDPCPNGNFWRCIDDDGCPSADDDHKVGPVCSGTARKNYRTCNAQLTVENRNDPNRYLEWETAKFKCFWPRFERCTNPPCAGGRYHNSALLKPFYSVYLSNQYRYRNLPDCQAIDSVTVGRDHWYFSQHQTTVDRASMACED